MALILSSVLNKVEAFARRGGHFSSWKYSGFRFSASFVNSFEFGMDLGGKESNCLSMVH